MNTCGPVSYAVQSPRLNVVCGAFTVFSIYRSTFIKLSNSNDGGAVYLNTPNADVSVSESYFVSCSTSILGGAGAFYNTDNYLVTRSCFIGCFATGHSNTFLCRSTSIDRPEAVYDSTMFLCSPDNLGNHNIIRFAYGTVSYSRNNATTAQIRHRSTVFFAEYTFATASYSTIADCTTNQFLIGTGSTNATYTCFNVVNNTARQYLLFRLYHTGDMHFVNTLFMNNIKISAFSGNELEGRFIITDCYFFNTISTVPTKSNPTALYTYNQPYAVECNMDSIMTLMFSHQRLPTSSPSHLLLITAFVLN